MPRSAKEPQPMPVPVPVKPGYKTSEFWLAFASSVLAAFLSSGLLPESHPAVKVAAFCAAALASLGYSVSRAHVKK